MARPDVTISAPEPMFVGRELLIEVVVDAAKETKVDFIEARLTGDQGWSVGAGKSQVQHRVHWPKLAATLMGGGVLAAGSTTRLAGRFVLPHGTPPTHEIGTAWSRMQLRVHVSIPWHLDRRRDVSFAVRIPPPEVHRTPVMIRSTADPGKPRIEIGLASSTLIAGEELVGTCAVFHLDDREPRDIELALVPELTLIGRGRARERRGREIAATMTVPAGSAGTSIPFGLALPGTMTPSFEAATHSLQWWLVARSGGFFSGKVDVAVPLTIVDRAAIDVTPGLTAAPRLGDERVARLFERFATAHQWKSGAPGAADFAIEKAIGALTIRIAYAYRGEGGTFVDASVHTPGLGLGLSVAPSSSLRHMFWKDIEVDIASWDRAHHVKARYPDQAIPFLEKVVPALMKIERIGTMIRWGDSELVHERQVADVTEEDLEIAAAQLEALAYAIMAALPAITPPPSLVVDVPAWRQLASWLGGVLLVGDLGIHGTLDGAVVDLGLGWLEDRPVSVHVSVGPPEAASEELGKIVITLPHPAADVLAANAAERLVELITRWPTDIVDLHVEHGVASAAYMLSAGAVDAARVRTLVEGLRAVLVALDPGSGPYR